MAYVLHHVPGSRSMRVLWLMEEMGLDYTLQTKTGANLKTPDYLALNPLGAVPALEIGDQVLLESGAILQYLLAQHTPNMLEPAKDDPIFASYLQWFHFGEATLAPWVVAYLINTKFKPPGMQNEAAATEARGRISALLDYLGWILESRLHIAADRFTAADIMVGHSLYVCRQNGLFDAPPQSVGDYSKRISARPAFGRAASS